MSQVLDFRKKRVSSYKPVLSDTAKRLRRTVKVLKPDGEVLSVEHHNQTKIKRHFKQVAISLLA